MFKSARFVKEPCYQAHVRRGPCTKPEPLVCGARVGFEAKQARGISKNLDTPESAPVEKRADEGQKEGGLAKPLAKLEAVRAARRGRSGMQLLPFREHLHELGDATGARLGFLGVLHPEQNSVTVA